MRNSTWIAGKIINKTSEDLKNTFILLFSHYISTPQLAFDCMLKSTKVEIEVLTDIDKILFVEQNLRGKTIIFKIRILPIH
jgi:hypothetical protein